MVRIKVEIEDELTFTKEFESRQVSEDEMATNFCKKICIEGILIPSCLEGDDIKKHIPPHRIKEIIFLEE